ncbi:MAG: LysM peptidoglycan-binding domain-containing protein [Pseudohongiella sp.]|nr:LysM peptidoglycan-binding domain-containing protein [Pseudohongiella sp.]MDP2125948.1 LysM peptidoglycan-binding domain-containing protein [Pseudohongiella sp.]
MKLTSLNRFSTYCLSALSAILLICNSATALAQNHNGNPLFPRPAELEPAIKFWTRVYTEVDTESGFLHDAENVSVIYRRVDYNRQELESYRRRIQEDLQILASGKRTNLTLTQQEVLDAWGGPGVSNSVLAAAVNNVRFQLGQSDRFVGGLIRSGAYREHIEKVARERGLPIELAALPHVESSFHPGAYSHANAAGMWQFIRTTGQRYMRIDNIVDERMDPYAATYAAMSLLEFNHGLLNSWPLALTAYNQGAGAMSRAVRELGTDNIATIVANYKGRNFGFAGRNFYPQFLAVLDVERQAQALFGMLHLDPAPEYDELELDAYVEADVLASALGVTIAQLKFDNPAIRPVVWEGGKRIPRGFKLKIQKDSINGSLASLISRMPGTQLYAYQTPDINYTIQRGDSLSAVASRFNTSVSQLVSLNQLTDAHRIRVGQVLLLPHDTNMITQTLVAATEPAPVQAGGAYAVRSGDTISSIARRYRVNESDILRLNGITNPNRLRIGQQLRLPADGDARVLAAAYTDAVEAPILTEAGLAGATEPGPEDSVELAFELVEEDVLAGNAQASLDLTADPSDYSVAADSSVEIHPTETLGHFAEWAGVRSQDVRSFNSMRTNQGIIVGQRIKVPFSNVSKDEFELRRRQYHLAQQERFFREYRIANINQHQLAANETIDVLARQRYSVPLWLLRQYNPDLNFSRVRVGQTIVVPIVARVDDV